MKTTMAAGTCMLALLLVGCSKNSSNDGGQVFPDPHLQISALIDFGSVELGLSSAPGHWTLSNQGEQELSISALGLSGAAAGDFAITSQPVLPLTLQKGQSVSLQLTFTPTSAGVRAAALDVTSNNGGQAGTVRSVGFSGTGFLLVAPVLSVSGNTDLGTSLIGVEASQSPSSISISNTGNADLVIDSIALSGSDASDFSLSGLPSLPATVAAGALVSFNLAFTPSQAAAHSASLDIRSNSLGIVSNLTQLGLQGEGLDVSRDALGIFFISGSPTAGLREVLEEFGYAVAVDRLWQLELFLRSGRGTLASVFGSGFLSQDISVRTVGYSESELQDAFDAFSSEQKALLEGYVAGVNRRIAEVVANPALLPFEFLALGILPSTWQVTDSLAWQALLLREFNPRSFSTAQLDNGTLLQELAAKFPADFPGMFEDLRWLNDPDALTYIPDADLAATPLTAGNVPPASYPQLPDLRIAADGLRQRREETLSARESINALVKWGSYAWAIAGSKTASGNPILYSGPQTGFQTPSLMQECSVRAGGLNIDGMCIAGLSGVVIGRTPHHAWSMQVGMAHTVDYYLEDPADVSLHRLETIEVVGGSDVVYPVYRSAHGPIVSPAPYDPTSYNPSVDGPIVAWKYSHWQNELQTVEGATELARATSMDEFEAGILKFGVSQHFTYADIGGNIAYFMSGVEPVRPAGEYRFPQPLVNPAEWDASVRRPIATGRNSSQGYYTGWNNKAVSTYGNPPGILYGPFHRAHVLDEYLSGASNLSYEQVRDLALNIATTDSFGSGGNPWSFVATDFSAAVAANPSTERDAAVALLAAWDGHFVDGPVSAWPSGTDRADAWVLADAWIREAIRLTFEDELDTATLDYQDQSTADLFNVMLHGLAGAGSGIVNNYDWFQNLANAGAPQTAEAVIIEALDNTLAALGSQPWGTGARGSITFSHDIFGPVHSMPFSSRSTWAHCVEMGQNGPVRIETFFALGQSGTILPAPTFDPHFFSYTPFFDIFEHTPFPLFP